MLPYRKPTLTCYDRADMGYYSATTVNANCQADCTSGNCAFVSDCSGTPCDACDTDDSQCGTGIVPAIDCFPLGC